MTESKNLPDAGHRVSRDVDEVEGFYYPFDLYIYDPNIVHVWEGQKRETGDDGDSEGYENARDELATESGSGTQQLKNGVEAIGA